MISEIASSGNVLETAQVDAVVRRACPVTDYHGRKVLLIVPDGTRTAPVGLMFKSLARQIGSVTSRLDVLIALGTHQPMKEEAICQRLEITLEERRGRYGSVRFFNHAWDDPAALRRIGTIPAGEIRALSGGLFEMDVPVRINKLLFEYDQIIIVGPVFPHEVVGFSGGNKYLFPGVSGPEVLNFFHWLGAVVTTPRIIGQQWTPVRKVVDRAAAMVDLPKLCFSMVAAGQGMAGLFAGTPESAWEGASELSRQLHVVYKERPFKTILSVLPEMYDELWTGGKGMYKLEPVLADGGELILYGPHIQEVCVTHHATLMAVGYHCRDYFLKQWDQFKHHPWGVLAHAAHVHGLGTFENGVEKARARVTLATGISEEICRRLNLGYRDPSTIRKEDFMNREEAGVLYVPKAGEMLFQLRNPPAWARVEG